VGWVARLSVDKTDVSPAKLKLCQNELS